MRAVLLVNVGDCVHAVTMPSSPSPVHDEYRYAYDVTFVGREVIGNVATLSRNTSVCSDFTVVGGGNADVSVETLNDGEAMGTSTTVQNVKVHIQLVMESTTNEMQFSTARLILTPSRFPR